MRLRKKLTILLGLTFLLAFAGLFIHDLTVREVARVVETDARPNANLSVTTLALSIRGQEIFSALTDLQYALNEGDGPRALQLLGQIEVKQRERESFLRAVRPKGGESPELAELLLRRERIVMREAQLLSALIDDLSASREKDERVRLIGVFMQGEYGVLERERRLYAEEIALLALGESGRSFDRIVAAIEQGHNLFISIIFTLVLSFCFVLFFISQRMIRPVEQITQTIEHISVGRLEASVPAELKDSNDEIGRLAGAFDRIIMSLKMSLRGQKREGK